MTADGPGMTGAEVDQAWLTSHPFGVVVRDWLEFMGRVIEFNNTVCSGIKAIGPIAAVTAVIGRKLNTMKGEQETQLRNAYESARREIDSDFELVHALTLLAAWGSFEAFIEDVCKAMLMADRTLLASKPFEKVKVPASVVVEDINDQIHLIFTEASKNLNTDLGTGIGKFEPLLKLVGLDGDISDELRNAVFYAQRTRNAWAHRAGKADKRFLEHCGHLGFSLGNTVKISTEQNDLHLRALMVYGLLVINRFLTAHRVKLIPFPGDENSPFADPYAKEWGTTPTDQPVTGWWAETNPT